MPRNYTYRRRFPPFSSTLMAAKAVSVEEIERMSVSSVRTLEESPPAHAPPRVTTLPSNLSAAKAKDVDDIELISVSC